MAKKQKTENSVKPAEVLTATPEGAKNKQNASGIELVTSTGGTHRLHGHDTLRIIDGPQATGYNPARTRKLDAIKWIVIHYTGCAGSAHTLARSFARPGCSASTHYFVDEKEVRAVLPWHRVAWHIGEGRPHAGYSGPRNFDGYRHATMLNLTRLGCSNNTSISIDICAKNVDGVWVLVGVDNASTLVRMLMEQLDIDVDHVVTHRDCTGKPCPQPWAADPSLFDEFKKLLKK